ncbi:MAG: YHYH protein [Ilumatobacteraceae bacterium]
MTNPLGTDSKFGADAHNAHTQPDGTYHYHGNPYALFDDHPGPDGSPVIGFAADGFPIYGSYFADPATGEVREAVSGYELKQGARPAGDANPPGDYSGMYYDDYEFTGAGDLDECNGMTVDGQYGYYVTDAFPYLMFCLSGTPDPSFDK